MDKNNEEMRKASASLEPLSEQEREDTEELYRGLQAIADDSFPRTCPRCGKVFNSADDFLVRETKGLHNSTGLRSSHDDEENQTVVEVYRNCPCGSTMVEFFRERRDMSEVGIRRRERFDKLLEILLRRKIPREEARQALLLAMRGQSSKILENLGLKFSNA